MLDKTYLHMVSYSIKRVVVPLLLGFLLSSKVHGQYEVKKDPRTLYLSAKDAYSNEKFSEAKEMLIETRNILGGSNIRIQPLIIKCDVKRKNWYSAWDEIQIYYGLNPDPDLLEFQEIKQFEVLVNEKILADQKLYTQIKNLPSEAKCMNYLENFPFGKYRAEVKKKLVEVKRVLKDKEELKDYQSAQTISELKEYLNKYPNGSYRVEVQISLAHSYFERFNQTSDVVKRLKYLKSAEDYISWARSDVHSIWRDAYLNKDIEENVEIKKVMFGKFEELDQWRSNLACDFVRAFYTVGQRYYDEGAFHEAYQNFHHVNYDSRAKDCTEESKTYEAARKMERKLKKKRKIVDGRAVYD